MKIELVQGDITRFSADAIVNAANTRLAGGGGVDGAIHRAGGPAILEECRRIGGCPTGSAAATGAGKMSAKYVFHAVGPVYSGRPKDAELLASAHRACLELARERKVKSLAFPAISTGAYRYPLEEAAEVAIRTVREFDRQHPDALDRVTFVLFDERALKVFRTALEEVKS